MFTAARSVYSDRPDELILVASDRVSVYDVVLPTPIPGKGKLLNAVSAGECVGEMAYARRNGKTRSATVTAIEPTWAMRIRVHDIDNLSDSCRARFNEAFLSIMADRLAMLGGRLVGM